MINQHHNYYSPNKFVIKIHTTIGDHYLATETNTQLLCNCTLVAVPSEIWNLLFRAYKFMLIYSR